MKTKRFVTALTILCFCAMPVRAADIEAGKAEGVLTVDGEAVELQYAYATTRPGTFDENTEDTLIFLSNMPLDERSLTDSGLLIQLESVGELKSVELTLDADHEPISIRVRHKAFGNGPSGRGNEEFVAGDIDTTHVEGRLHTTQVEDFFGTTYEYDVSFNAEIYRKVPAGKPTAEDMAVASASPQAEIYRVLTAAVIAGDVEAMKQLVTPDLLTELDGPNAADVVGYLQAILPKQVEFLRITVDAGNATLEMRSEDGGAMQTGSADFALDGEDWKIGLSQWEG